MASEFRRKRGNSMEFKLEWRPELVPCSKLTLQELGVPGGQLPRDGQQVCICYLPSSGQVSCAAAPRSRPEAAINVSYLACALRVLRDHGCEPQFSLDPQDPHNLGGKLLKKSYYPSWLAGTVVGEVLFQADYTLKELCFGDRELPFLPNVFDEVCESASGSGDSHAARQWFTMRRAGVTVAADGAIVPTVSLGVEARRLVPSKTGFVDSEYTDQKDPMVRQAAAVTEHFDRVAEELPIVGELLHLARAVLVARFLLERGCRRNESVLDRYMLPSVPEGPHNMAIPTLVKERRSSAVLQSQKQEGQLTVVAKKRAMYGGVDLKCPTKKVLAKSEPANLLEKHARPVPLPLFLSAAAA